MEQKSDLVITAINKDVREIKDKVSKASKIIKLSRLIINDSTLSSVDEWLIYDTEKQCTLIFNK